MTDPAPAAGRDPARTLFWRLFLLNGLVFAIGTLVLALSPATVSAPVVWTEVPVLVVGLALMLAANALLLRAGLAPLGSLTALMQRVDLLRAGDRLPEKGNGDLSHVIATFNQMLDRLEAERIAGAGHALAAQEGERTRIARELHDEIGQSLTVVLLSLKRIVDRAPDDLQDELHAVQDAVRVGLEEVRGVAHRLRPGVLEDLGLRAALKALAGDFAQIGGIEVDRRIDAALPALPATVELVLYRIAQEGLTNVARHAGAGHVLVALAARPEGVVLRISDDGKGGADAEGAGIRGMRERALLVGARLEISSPPGAGTEVTLTVPAHGRDDGGGTAA